jgi:hypothetical protein
MRAGNKDCAAAESCVDCDMDRSRIQKSCFVVGFMGVVLYIVCLVIPYERYFRGGPAVLPQEAPGYLRYEPIGFVAYFLSYAENGCLWMTICAISIFHGEPPIVSPRLRVIFRFAAVLLLVWAASYIRSFQDNITSVLD